ncbi:hypothetical protein HYH03_018263 [Edaphochlamys debaryana]|uniref:Right handed beta helix domain-containing protein n=1 Tax=Edaphochlamys debaryana TaxID=47281 RepID=A0A835XIA6_9CHLO|nr:hypothetical protein HYH03_018263 [Edaphochlamys debaryana]|eukprot:KAG2482826.1 hypothetical protein HYH03_018263 [Edaphochlamys debaryana]
MALAQQNQELEALVARRFGGQSQSTAEAPGTPQRQQEYAPAGSSSSGPAPPPAEAHAAEAEGDSVVGSIGGGGGRGGKDGSGNDCSGSEVAGGGEAEGPGPMEEEGQSSVWVLLLALIRSLPLGVTFRSVRVDVPERPICPPFFLGDGHGRRRDGADAKLEGVELGPAPEHGLAVYGASASAVRCTARHVDAARDLAVKGVGFMCDGGGSNLQTEGCCAKECGHAGFASASGGVLEAGAGCVARNCRHGFTTDGEGSALLAGEGCVAEGMTEDGYRAQAIGCEEEGFSAAGLGSTMTLGRGCMAKECEDGFSVGEEATLDASAGGCRATNNTRHGFLSEKNGSLLLGPGSVARENGEDGFLASLGGEVKLAWEDGGAAEGAAELAEEAINNGGAGFRATGEGSCMQLPGEGRWVATGNAGGDEPLGEDGGLVLGDGDVVILD